ncbi:MAG: hypothetical protein V1256_10185, partial [Candidatus Neomarinimicrobiota bacterium]|nr:hypothetical protein [Candidatus Neomarinimicrobiota bacterium]
STMILLPMKHRHGGHYGLHGSNRKDARIPPIKPTLQSALSKSGPRAARSRLATTGSLISPEPLFDLRRSLLWLLGGKCA